MVYKARLGIEIRVRSLIVPAEGVPRFSVLLSRSGGVFSEAVSCLMGLHKNPLSKEASDGSQDTRSQGGVQRNP
jgi:hypothetical protein